MKKVILFCAACLFLASCSWFKSEKSPISHFPFKNSEKDNWGLIDVKGKVLVENEFQNQPTNIVNGIFFVENKKGNYEMYSVDNPRTPIGDSYKSITPFFEEVTPCAMENEGIKYIDKKGNVVFELSREYAYAYPFLNGYSIILRKDKTTDEYVRDAVSTDGQIFKFKKYSLYSVIDKETFLARDDNGNYFLIDHNGDIKNRLKDFYDYLYNPDYYTKNVFSPDMQHYVYYDNELESAGIKNINGDITIKAKENRFCNFLENGQVLFYIINDDDSEDWYFKIGLMDINGNTLIKAQYSDFVPMGEDLYIVAKDHKYGLIDGKGETLIPFEYVYMEPLSEKILLAKTKEDSDILLLDKEGKVQGEYAEFVKANYPQYVESDYLDVYDMLNSLMNPLKDDEQTINNFFGYMGLTPDICVNKMDVVYSKEDIDDSNQWLPEKEMTSTDYGTIYYSLGFDQVVETNTEYDYNGNSNTYYCYSTSTCNSIKLNLFLNYKNKNHKSFIEKQLPKAMEKCGFSKDSDYSDNLHYTNYYVNVYVEVTDEEINLFTTPCW